MIKKLYNFAFFAAIWCLLPMSANASVSTLWPLLDYRASEQVQYKSLHLAGPFVKYEEKGPETEYALRPLFYRAVDEDGVSQTDVLYPVFGHKRDKDASSFHIFHLLNYDFGKRETGSRNRSYLFPFLFYGEEEQGSYAAFFPLGGRLYNWFGRDRISFTLFPLYSQTQRDETIVNNYLWPFFARIKGPDESGFKVWPIYGQSSKQGVYQKRFFLWPVFFSEDSRLDTENPVEKRAVWPFYVSEESNESSYRALLWPFFSKKVDRVKGYESISAPWPLVRITKGDKYHGLKLLPFYSDETMDARRERWYLWPLYKIENLSTELIERRRDRVFFFLYSDTKENKWETGDYKRRIDLWPLFGYQRVNGVSHLHVLSLVEPFFPSNQSIERLWSPLWRVYQQKWDEQGNRVVSLLWNLYWHEKRGDQVAWELFPLLSYRKESALQKDVSFLKGLVRYQRDGEGRQLKLFYLPWGISWGSSESDISVESNHRLEE
jgi:hypothetical protein